MSALYQHALPAGKRIEEFELTTVLGAGGFGVTYKGLDHKFQREVAIKEFLPGELAVRDPETGDVVPRTDAMRGDYQWGLNRFLEESRTLAKFDDPHIVKVHRYLEANRTAYLVMQYIDGESLSQFLTRRRNGMPEDEIRHFLVPILKGLEVVHSRDYLHRDIKPSNIYLRRDGPPMLIDFGAARHALSEHSRTMLSMMTPGYAPFEQYSSNAKQGAYTDLYAMGATVYRCMTGRSPAEAADRMTALTEGRADPLVVISDENSGKYSDLLLAAVDWMLQLRPADRPQSVREVLDCLEGDTSRAAANPATRATRTVVLRTAKRFNLPKLPHWQAREPGWLGQLAIDVTSRAAMRLAALPLVRAWLEWQSRARAKLNEKSDRYGSRLSGMIVSLVQRYRSNQSARGTIRLALLLLIFFAYALSESRWQLQPGDVFRDPLRDGSSGPALAVIPAGQAISSTGSLKMPRAFALSTREITFDEYDHFAAETLREKPADAGWGRSSRPVINVSWRDANAYAQWLSAQTGRNYRLPTESEWEYAARGGAVTPFWWGRVVGTNHANCADCGSQWDGKQTAPAANFEANPFGLYDMTGNVAEWTCSIAAEQPDPAGRCAADTDQRRRVTRGGSWQSASALAAASARADARPDQADTTLGFRVMVDLPNGATHQ